jgi:hypothetical protein
LTILSGFPEEGSKVLQKLIDVQEGCEKLLLLSRRLLYILEASFSAMVSPLTRSGTADANAHTISEIRTLLSCVLSTLCGKRKAYSELQPISPTELLVLEKHLLDYIVHLLSFPLEFSVGESGGEAKRVCGGGGGKCNLV